MHELKKKSIRTQRLLVLSLASVVCLAILLKGLSIQGKMPFTDEGQTKLMQEVNAGQKSKQLTVKESDKLRKELACVARKKKKMLENTNRKLSIEDIAELKSDINKISQTLHKYESDKSAQGH